MILTGTVIAFAGTASSATLPLTHSLNVLVPIAVPKADFSLEDYVTGPETNRQAT